MGVDVQSSAMPHHDDHAHDCGEHAHGDDHDHNHTSNGGPSDNLFAHIDRNNVVALNSVQGGSEVIKPWDERMDEQVVSQNRLAHKECLRDHCRPRRAVYRVGRGRSAVGTGAPLWPPSYSLLMMTMLTHTRLANSIIRVPFTGSVKLRSLLLKSGPGDQTPAKVSLVSVFVFMYGREKLC